MNPLSCLLANRTGRRSSLALILATLVCASGCSRSARDRVSGKVTFKGQPVAGTVSFLGIDGKEVSGPINPDGTYAIADPPVGEVKIVVKAFPGLGQATPARVNARLPRLPDMPAPAPTLGVPPPIQYAAPNNGLTVNVMHGVQHHDIALNP
jgi:hypothetical protein